MDVTSKNTTIDKDANKKLIEEIENLNVSVDEYNTIMFILNNMKFKNWISLFTCKNNRRYYKRKRLQ